MRAVTWSFALVAALLAVSSPAAAASGFSPADIAVSAPPVLWESLPRDLPRRVTPLYVQINNRSHQAIRVRFRDLRLVSGGFSYLALAPQDVTGVTYQPLIGRPLVRGGIGTMPLTQAVPLPTSDMLRLGLREGVVQPGGAVAGFVYFQLVVRLGGRLTLEADLIDADTAGLLGRAVVPLRING